MIIASLLLSGSYEIVVSKVINRKELLRSQVNNIAAESCGTRDYILQQQTIQVAIVHLFKVFIKAKTQRIRTAWSAAIQNRSQTC